MIIFNVTNLILSDPGTGDIGYRDDAAELRGSVCGLHRLRRVDEPVLAGSHPGAHREHHEPRQYGDAEGIHARSHRLHLPRYCKSRELTDIIIAASHI